MKTPNNGLKKEQKLQFPVKFNLKVMMSTPENNKVNINLLEPVLNNLNISFGKWSSKLSSKGTYTSYTVSVSIKNQEIMNSLYEDLKTVPGVKMAL